MTGPGGPLPVARRHLAHDGRQFTWLAQGPMVPMHLHRHLFAAALAEGRRVLLLGAGEGYGAAILARGAASVTAIDPDPRNVAHSRAAYRHSGAVFEQGDPANPPPSPQADLVAILDLRLGALSAGQLLDRLASRPEPPDLVLLALPPEEAASLEAPAGWTRAARYVQSFRAGSLIAREGEDTAPALLARRGFREIGEMPAGTPGGAPDRLLLLFRRGPETALPGPQFFHDPTVITGLNSRIRALERSLAESLAEPSARDVPTAPRTLIFHHHICRNAGSSVDRLLEAAFGVARQSFEPEAAERGAALAELEAWIAARPGLRAVSSLTCPFAPTDFGRVRLLPLVFLRDPLARLLSAYRVERRQDGDEPRHHLARSSDFEGYVTGMLDGPQRARVADFQTARLASLIGPPDPRDARARARAAFHALPFVGLADRLARSMEVYARLYREVPLIAADAHANAARDFPDGLEGETPETLLSEATRARLAEANAGDAELLAMAGAQPALGAPTEIRPAAPAVTTTQEDTAIAPRDPSLRPLLIHCHCFKNAGSTFDQSVIRSLGAEALLEMDKHPDYRDARPYGAALMARIAAAHPEAMCLSSHQTAPPVEIPGIRPVTVAFLRHPLLRAASVYRFEKKRGDAPALQASGFSGWLETMMDSPHVAEAKNYQAALFSLTAEGEPDLDPAAPGRAVHLDALIARLDGFSAVGIVEEFDRTAALLHAAIRPYFPGFALGGAENRTKEVADWRAEAAALEATLPPATLARFEALNAQDRTLFERYLDRLP